MLSAKFGVRLKGENAPKQSFLNFARPLGGRFKGGKMTQHRAAHYLAYHLEKESADHECGPITKKSEP
jgi:hypothetical protein